MNILLVEDEPQTARMLQDTILEVKPHAQILAVLDSIEGVVRFFCETKQKPDLIFMDIQLADGLSFDIFSKVDIKSPVIFCTAYDQYSLQAFKANGVDYLLKPVKEEDVAAAFQKLETFGLLNKPEVAVLDLLKKALQAEKPHRKVLLVPYRENLIPLSISNVAIFLVDTEILYAYTFDQQKYPLTKPIAEIENDLDPQQFFRISRQAIVNREAIVEIQPYFGRKVCLKTPVKLPETLVVSRLKVSSFLHWMEEPSST